MPAAADPSLGLAALEVNISSIELALSRCPSSVCQKMADPDAAMLTAFREWKTEHGRVYSSVEEESIRFEYFREHVRNANAAIARGDVLDHPAASGRPLHYNAFADYSNAEWRRRFPQGGVAGRLKSLVDPLRGSTHAEYARRAQNVPPAPTSKDWRGRAVTAVEDQGNCGSCWSFTTVGAIEGAWGTSLKAATDTRSLSLCALFRISAALIPNNTGYVQLSMQQLISCDPEDNGCNGGNPASGERGYHAVTVIVAPLFTTLYCSPRLARARESPHRYARVLPLRLIRRQAAPLRHVTRDYCPCSSHRLVGCAAERTRHGCVGELPRTETTPLLCTTHAPAPGGSQLAAYGPVSVAVAASSNAWAVSAEQGSGVRLDAASIIFAHVVDRPTREASSLDAVPQTWTTRCCSSVTASLPHSRLTG